jgi:hypothetical protein
VAVLAHVAAPTAAVRAWGTQHGLTWLAAATAANVLAGASWFLVLGRPVRDQFHGGDLAASVVLAVGVLLSFVLIVDAWRGRRRQPASAVIVRTGAVLTLTLALMVLTRDTVRTAMLAPHGYAPVSWVVPQWPLIVGFVALLVVALGSMAWMVRALWTAPSRT